MTSYEMYTEAGDRAVQDKIITPVMAVIEGAQGERSRAGVRERCALAVEEGMRKVQEAGHREVSDTEVREAIYGTIGQELINRGLTTDRWNWDEET